MHNLGRNFLHAAAIEFLHPRSGEIVKFEAPLPKELEGVKEEKPMDLEAKAESKIKAALGIE